jgi:hypothetical protein
VCEIEKHAKWLKRVQANCYNCMDSSNVCHQRSQVLYHQFVGEMYADNWQANMWSIQSFLLTQVSKQVSRRNRTAGVHRWHTYH